MTLSLVAGDLARTRRTTLVSARWHPDNCVSESADQVVRVIHVDLEWTWSFSPRSPECGCIQLEDLEKVSDDDHVEPTLRACNENTEI